MVGTDTSALGEIMDLPKVIHVQDGAPSRARVNELDIYGIHGVNLNQPTKLGA